MYSLCTDFFIDFAVFDSELDKKVIQPVLKLINLVPVLNIRKFGEHPFYGLSNTTDLHPEFKQNKVCLNLEVVAAGKV